MLYYSKVSVIFQYWIYSRLFSSSYDRESRLPNSIMMINRDKLLTTCADAPQAILHISSLLKLLPFVISNQAAGALETPVKMSLIDKVLENFVEKDHLSSFFLRVGRSLAWHLTPVIWGSRSFAACGFSLRLGENCAITSCNEIPNSLLAFPDKMKMNYL